MKIPAGVILKPPEGGTPCQSTLIVSPCWKVAKRNVTPEVQVTQIGTRLKLWANHHRVSGANMEAFSMSSVLPKCGAQTWRFWFLASAR